METIPFATQLEKEINSENTDGGDGEEGNMVGRGGENHGSISQKLPNKGKRKDVNMITPRVI